MGGKIEGRMGRGSWHPLNQRGEKLVRNRGSAFDPMNKAVEAESRRERMGLSMEEFEEIKGLAYRQSIIRSQRTLQHHMLHGEITRQDLEYVAQNEKIIEIFTTPKGTQVTVVDFI